VYNVRVVGNTNCFRVSLAGSILMTINEKLCHLCLSRATHCCGYITFMMLESGLIQDKSSAAKISVAIGCSLHENFASDTEIWSARVRLSVVRFV